MGDGSLNPYDQKGKGRAQNGDVLSLDLDSAEEGGGHASNGFMQMQLIEQQVLIHSCSLNPPEFLKCLFQDSYIQQRSTAIESIETTIAELGQIFTQLANMVAEQRETVQRIDSDTHDIMDNVTGAQRELLIFYNSVSSNRWLILKIFGVLIVFVRFYLPFHCGINSDSFLDSSLSLFLFHDLALDGHVLHIYGTFLTTSHTFNSISTFTCTKS